MHQCPIHIIAFLLLIIYLGSCWALGVMHSGVVGSVQPEAVARHLQDRIQVSYLDKSTLDALVSPPTNKVRVVLCPIRRTVQSSWRFSIFW